MLPCIFFFFFLKKMYFGHSFSFLGSEFEQKRAFQETMYLFSSVLFFVANKESGKAADQTSSNVEKPSLKFMDLVQCFFEDFRTSEMFVYYDELSGHIQTKSITDVSQNFPCFFCRFSNQKRPCFITDQNSSSICSWILKEDLLNA